MPLVSCLCATYGRFALLREAVACFLLQDYPAKELIVLNNHPTPIRCELPGVTVVNMPGHSDLGSCRRTLLKLAQGDIFNTWDDDDRWLPWHLSQGVERLLASGRPAWKPARSWRCDLRSGKPVYDLWSSGCIASALVRADHVRKVGYVPSSGDDDVRLLQSLMSGPDQEGRASAPVWAVEEMGCRASYIYTWTGVNNASAILQNGLPLAERDALWKARNADSGAQALPPGDGALTAADVTPRFAELIANAGDLSEDVAHLLAPWMAEKIQVGGFTLFSTPGEWSRAQICEEILSSDIYGARTLGKDIKTVLDVGAHIGTFTLLAKSLWPAAKILAYEPDPENFALLRRNVPDEQNVSMQRAALLDSAGKVSYFKSRTNSGGGAVECGAKGFPAQPVDCADAAEVVRSIDQVDVLKLDCEGAETRILRRLRDAGLMSRVGYVCGEYHDGLGGAPKPPPPEFVALFAETHDRLDAGNDPQFRFKPKVALAPSAINVHRSPQKLISDWSGTTALREIEDGKKYLIRCPRGLGDAVMFWPCFEALKAARPKAEISVAFQPGHGEIFPGSVADEPEKQECAEYGARYDGVFVVGARMESESQTKPKMLCFHELGIPNPKKYASFETQRSPLVGLHFWAGTPVASTTRIVSEHVARAIWSEVGEAGFIPVDLEFPRRSPPPPIWDWMIQARQVVSPQAVTARNLLGLIQRCFACVVVDSAPLHLATAALGVQRVMLIRNRVLMPMGDLGWKQIEPANYAAGAVKFWLEGLT
jgi:FkbM family methyltransferase